MQALIALMAIPITLLLFGLYVDGIMRWMRRYHREFFATLAVAGLLAALLQWRAAGHLTVQAVLNGLAGFLYGLVALFATFGEQSANGPQMQ